MTLKMNDKTYTRVFLLTFVFNLIFLAWAILWKCGVPFIGDGAQRIINLVPFHGNTRWEMQFNVLLFLPFGFLLSAVLVKRIVPQFLVVVFTSVLLEIAQYVLAVGRSDITDVILNSLGGFIGIGTFYLLVKIFGKRSRIAITLACLLIGAFELYVSVSYILFGMVRIGSIMFRM